MRKACVEEDRVQENRCCCLTGTREITQGQGFHGVLFLHIVGLHGMKCSKRQADV